MKSANSKIKPITLGSVGSRIRISTILINELGWDQYEGNFDCYGFFRFSGELVIAPKLLKTTDELHPFHDILEYCNQPDSDEVMLVSEMPSAAVITAPNRLIEFDAKWVNSKKKQLDINLGVDSTRRLGWEKGQQTQVYPAIWGQILILLSRQYFKQSQEQELF